MIFDQTGSLANISRHDYLPFGEELFAGTGGRTAPQGYTLSDNESRIKLVESNWGQACDLRFCDPFASRIIRMQTSTQL